MHGRAGDIEDLKVFRLAYAVSLDVHRASLSWPKVEQYGGVADQVRRASKAVCALMVEGSGRLRGSRAEFRRYLLMALGSADEARLWCRYAEDLGYIDTAQAARWRAAFAEVARMLQGLVERQRQDLPDHRSLVSGH